jgi:hypothetical protein
VDLIKAENEKVAGKKKSSDGDDKEKATDDDK